MISAQWKKALNDVVAYPGRSLQVVVAIAVGLVGIGSVLTSYVILTRDMPTNYLGTNPASAVLWTEQPLTELQRARVLKLPEIAAVEGRRSFMGRILTGPNQWQPIRIFAVEDFQHLQLNTFTFEAGQAPTESEIAIERDSWRLIKTPIGESLSLRLKEGARQTLRISARVHDPGLAPAHMDHLVYGYVRASAYERLAGANADDLPRLLISVSSQPFDRDHLRAVALRTKAELEAQGARVARLEVPVPGRHPHQGQLESLLFLQAALGLLSFVLCTILILNITAFLLARQVKQIGVMKAIGASPAQVMRLYFVSIAGLGSIGALIGVPLGIAGGLAYARFAAHELNFNLFTTEAPAWVSAALMVTAICMPLLVALGPIWRGTRVSVLTALADRGLGTPLGTATQQTMSGTSLLPRPAMLALRAAFRRRGRTFFTMATLALGLAILSIALNLRATLQHTLNQSSESERFSLSVYLGRPYSRTRLEAVTSNLDGVRSVSLWQGNAASLVYGDGTQSNPYPLVAPPVPTPELAPVLIAGAWLSTTDALDEVVVNQALINEERALQVGSTLTMLIEGRPVSLRLVGITKEMSSLPALYVRDATLNRLLQRPPEFTTMRIATVDEAPVAQRALSELVEQRLEAAGLDVIATVRKAEHLKMIDDHLKIITNFLLVSSLLALVVAGLGLLSTTSINLIERSRETGVMRAIGASLGTLRGLFLLEGLTVGALAWLLGQALAWPLSAVVSEFFGSLIFKTPLELKVAPAGPPMSFAVMLVFVLFAIATASAPLSRSTAHDALSYE